MEQDNPFKLTNIQHAKITRLLENYIPTSFDEELKASVYNQYQDEFAILIYQFNDNGRFSVRTLDGIELSKTEIDTKIWQVRNEHLPRVDTGTNGKIKSISTIANGPDPKLLNAKAVEKFPLEKHKELANLAMESIDKEFSTLTSEQIFEQVEYQLLRSHFAQEFARRKNIQTFRNAIGQADSNYQVKKQEKLTKADKRAAKLKIKEERKASAKTPVKLEKWQIAMKVMGLDWNNPEDLANYNAYQASLTKSNA